MKFKLPDVVNSMLFTEENKQPTETPTPKQTTTTNIPTTVAIPSSFTLPTPVPLPVATSDGSNPFVATIKAKIDFNTTTAGQKIQELLAPLDGLPISEEQKMQVVLKGGVKDGLTKDQILTTLDNLLGRLDIEHGRFDTTIQGLTKAEIDTRKQKIDSLAQGIKDAEAMISNLRQQQSDISTELITAQTKIEQKKAQFQVAYDSCKNELNATISHYQSILKG